MKTVFLASASPDAPVPFNQRMRLLQESLAGLRPLAPDPLSADLMIAVTDELTLPLMNVIRMRCEARKHLRVFYPIGSDPCRMITDCISVAREQVFGTFGMRVAPEVVTAAYSTLADPIGYRQDLDIVENISSFFQRFIPRPEVVRSVC